MVSKYIALPFTIIILLSIFSLLGLGSGSLTQSMSGSGGYGSGQDAKNPGNYTGWVDISGRLILNSNAEVVVNDSGGYLTSVTIGFNYGGGFNYYWNNGTGKYLLTEVGAITQGNGQESTGALQWNLSTSLGLLVIVVLIMGVGVVVGFHVFGSGENDVSVGMVLKNTGFLMLWAVFSSLSLHLLTLIPDGLGDILYFVLTGMLTIGLIDSIGHPSGGYD